MSKFRASIIVITVCALTMIAMWAMAQTPAKSGAKTAEAKAPTTAVVVGKPAEIKVKISGAGAINDSTIKAGEKVFLDVYLASDKPHRGMTFGLKLSSPDIKNVVHVADSGNGLNKNGDIKGLNGWQDKSVWDLGFWISAKSDWDGTLPDFVGVGGATVKQRLEPQDFTKHLSLEMIVPEPGTLVVDSTFFPPAGKWKFSEKDQSGRDEVPAWKGPYKFKVVK
jgi:hypothetical protein